MTITFKDLDTKQLTRLTGMSPSFISQVRTGRRKLPIKYVKPITLAFGITRETLRPDVYL